MLKIREIALLVKWLAIWWTVSPPWRLFASIYFNTLYPAKTWYILTPLFTWRYIA